jgi:glutamine---fructose-6-phosphate transaminase (isomerizing)
MNQQQNFVTYDEILSQTDAWCDAIEIVESKTTKISELNLSSYSQILFIGCGSTYYLSMAAASQFRSITGNMALALPSSELLFPNGKVNHGKILLIAISRSGTTSETLKVVSNFKENKLGDVIVITNYSESPLSKLGDISISIDKGQENSVVQTRSFASMYIAVTTFIQILGSTVKISQHKEALKKTGNKLIEKYENLANTLANNHSINQVFYLGSGPRYGLASELNLKLKEMSQTVSEAYHFFEFRHGPISMVNENTLVIGLMSEGGYSKEKMVLEDAEKFGAKTLMIGEKDTDIEFKSGLPENLQGVLFLPIMQLFAYYRCLSFGKNPDKPRNITAVVELDSNKL